MIIFGKNDEGKAVVIGVVLMMAITMSLSLATATFVSTMGTFSEQKYTSVFVGRVNETCISVKVLGHDAMQLEDFTSCNPARGSLNVTANGVEVYNTATSDGTNNVDGPFNNAMPGTLQCYYGVPADAQVSIIGNFQDNTRQVIWSGII